MHVVGFRIHAIELRAPGVVAQLMSGDEIEVKVEELRIEPNNCPLAERLALSMKFVLPQPLPAACWRVRVAAAHPLRKL